MYTFVYLMFGLISAEAKGLKSVPPYWYKRRFVGGWAHAREKLYGRWRWILVFFLFIKNFDEQSNEAMTMAFAAKKNC